MKLAGNNLELGSYPAPEDQVTPRSWPPDPEFPISRNKAGEVVSRYRDSVWNFSHQSGKQIVLNFGDGPQRKGRPQISFENATLLRKLAAWFLFGPRPVREATTLKSKFKLVRPIFVHCSAAGITASDLYRFPAVIESLGAALSPSRFNELIGVLHSIYEQREQLGFHILDRGGIGRVSACVLPHQKQQTPYIPPRIWSYVLNRSREFIDDYVAHLPSIEACYNFCLEMYANGAGSLEAACIGGIGTEDRPFGPTDPNGRFADVCARFGIKELLERWVVPKGSKLEESELGIRIFSFYFGMVGYVGTLYIIAFSLMRIDEAWKLRCDCWQVRQDDDFGEIYLIQGATTKTVKDASALWVTSKSTEDAITAMSSVARLRMQAAAANPDVPTTMDYLGNPYLVPRPYEPWTNRKSIDADMWIRQTPLSLDKVFYTYPRLLDNKSLIISQEDAEVARRVNPTLDDYRYAVGKTWPFAWHQFRRTGAVNMFSSGIVTDLSVQHQLKHMTLQMTHFYGQGFSDLALDESTRAEVLRTMYEMTAIDAIDLFGEDFVSVYGEDRKHQALAPINGKEIKELRKLAKNGKFPWRETPFGGCTKPGPCEFGGFDNVIHCGGGDGNPSCVHGIFDKRKKSDVIEMAKRINLQLVDAPKKSALEAWLIEGHAALTNIIDVMSKEPQQ